MLSLRETFPTDPVKISNALVELMTRAGIPEVSSYGVCFGRGMMAVIAMLTNQLAGNDELHQALYDSYANNNRPDPQQLAYLKTIQLFNDPPKHNFLPDAPLQHTQATGVQVILDYLSSKVTLEYAQLDAKIQVLDIVTGAYNRDGLISFFELLAQQAHRASVKPSFSLPLLIASSKHAVAVGYSIDKKTWSITDTSSLQTAYFETARELSSDLWKRLARSVRAEHVVFSTRMFSDAVNLEAVKAIWDAWRIDPLFTQLHDVNAILSQEYKNRWLISATADGDEDKVDALLKQGADVNYRDERGRSPFWEAAENGRASIMRKICEASTESINERFSAFKATALYIAACYGREDTVAVLLRHGADANIARDLDHETPLIAASRRSLTNVAQQLIPHSDIRLTNNLGQSALYIAAIFGRVEIVRALLAADANPLQKTNDKQTPLSATIYYLDNPSMYHKRVMLPGLKASIDLMKAHVSQQQSTRLTQPVAGDSRVFTPASIPASSKVTVPSSEANKHLSAS